MTTCTFHFQPKDYLGFRYEPNLDCEWLVQVEESYQVEFQFKSLFVPSGPGCADDYLELRDGGQNGASSNLKSEQSLNQTVDESAFRIISGQLLKLLN